MIPMVVRASGMPPRPMLSPAGPTPPILYCLHTSLVLHTPLISTLRLIPAILPACGLDRNRLARETSHDTLSARTRFGGVVYWRGRYDVAFRGARGKTVKDRGKYLGVWRKQSDGAWRVMADIFNSDLPQAPSAR